MLSGEATNTNVIVFGLTRPGFESKIYRTRGENANHYATIAVYRTLELGWKAEYGNSIGFTSIFLEQPFINQCFNMNISYILDKQNLQIIWKEGTITITLDFIAV